MALRQRKRQKTAEDMAGASKLSRGAYGERSAPGKRLETMMNFDHMDPAQTAAWKKDYAKLRAGKRKRDAERLALEARHKRGRSY